MTAAPTGEPPVAWNAEQTARLFHNYYEKLAPEFGYETRVETREFDSSSKNGRLMIAVCEQVINDYRDAHPAASPPAGVVVPTEAMIDAPRGILQFIRCNPGATYGQVFEHCSLRDDAIELWPEWALKERGYVTEAGAALLIFQVMLAAKVTP